MEPPRLPRLPEPAAAVRQALQRPLGSPPLVEIVRPGGRVCIVLSDRTRVTGHQVFLPVLLGELTRAGSAVPEVIFASGAHRPMPAPEMRAALGRVAGRVRFQAHTATGACEWLGDTARGTPVLINRWALEADHLILTGSVVHHSFAGFGGGPKAVFPGLAAVASIEANHRLLLEPGAAGGALEGNPVHEDLAEAAALARPSFLLNTVTDPGGRLAGVFAGGMVAAHRAACVMARTREMPLAGLADLVVASAGGHPRDIDFYQSQKALENAARAVRPGGVVVLVAACRDGVGSAAFRRWAGDHRSLPELSAALARRFELGGHKAWSLARIASRVSVILLSGLDPAVVREFGLRPAVSPRDAIDQARELSGDRPLTYLMRAAALTVPVVPDPACAGEPGLAPR